MIKKIVLFLAALLLTASGYIAAEFARFPGQIQLLEGQAKRLEHPLPIQVTLEAADAYVLKLNDLPLEGRVTLRPNGGDIIKPKAPGSAVMRFGAFGLPFRQMDVNVLPDMQVAPCGMAVSVRVNTDGVMVLGMGSVEGADGPVESPSAGILQPGDFILRANEADLRTKEEFERIIRESEAAISLEVKRDNEVFTASVTPVAHYASRENQIGVWVRDGTQGIGTVTYFNPKTNRFAALGHGIVDADTKRMINVKSGEIKASAINTVVKGKRGAPGELVGSARSGGALGHVERNSAYGVFGTINPQSRAKMPREKMPIALQSAIHAGPAVIRSNVERDRVAEYDIYIESVNRNAEESTRGMVIRITDPALLARTNGIVQGMSGSPIIQNGRLIGAVTHVFVQEPAKGYGIFIENMLKYELGLYPKSND